MNVKSAVNGRRSLSAILSWLMLCLSFRGFCQEAEIKGQDMSNSLKETLVQMVFQGRFDTFRSGAICSPLPQADFQETDVNSLYAWGIDYAPGNGVMEKNGNRIPTEEEIDRTIAYFSSQNLPFIWWTSANVLEAKGFQFGGILKGIALDISEEVPSNLEISPDLSIQVVNSESELSAFTDLGANAFAMNPKARDQWFVINDGVMKRGEQVHLMAYLKGILAGTATLSVSPSSAGIWNLATLPEYRKQGIGGALVHAALVEAKKRGYNQAMAILMPKGLAWGLFTRLGFRAFCEFPFYVYGASAEELEK